jgi:hypothetical protein
VQEGLAKGASIGTIAGVAGYAALSAKIGRPQNHLANSFWGLKGAVAGGALGAAISAAIPQTSAHPKESTQRKAAKRAFLISGVGSALSSAAILSEPFIRSKKVKSALNFAAIAGQGLSFAAPYAQAVLNRPGTKTTALFAGGAGAILGTNLLRLGGPLMRNRKRLGLRRVF